MTPASSVRLCALLLALSGCALAQGIPAGESTQVRLKPEPRLSPEKTPEGNPGGLGIKVVFPARAGHLYQPQTSADGGASWVKLGEPLEAKSTELTVFNQAPGADTLRYRLAAVAVRPGFDQKSLPKSDSAQAREPFGFKINFLGMPKESCMVKTAGYLALEGNEGVNTAHSLRECGFPIIAPFLAQADTTLADAGDIVYGHGEVDGHPAFAVHWRDVSYYSGRNDKHNSFQAVVIDRSDVQPGDFDLEFNYDRIEWEEADSNGIVPGLWGRGKGITLLDDPFRLSPRVGFSKGLRTPHSPSFEVFGSGEPAAFLDICPPSVAPGSAAGPGLPSRQPGQPNPSALIYRSIGSDVPGRLLFHSRGGVIAEAMAVDASAEGGQQDFLTEEANFILAGTVSGGTGEVITAWTMEEGPAEADIAQPTSPATRVTLPKPGVYIFRLTAANALGAVSDTVTVIRREIVEQPQ